MDRSNFFTRLCLAAAIVLVSMVAVGRAAVADHQSDYVKRMTGSTKVPDEVMSTRLKVVPAGVVFESTQKTER
jgi:hypothetical protein